MRANAAEEKEEKKVEEEEEKEDLLRSQFSSPAPLRNVKRFVRRVPHLEMLQVGKGEKTEDGEAGGASRAESGGRSLHVLWQHCVFTYSITTGRVRDFQNKSMSHRRHVACTVPTNSHSVETTCLI